MTYKEMDQNIAIEVFPALEESQTSEKHSFYFYTYNIKITNLREDKIQLLDRQWLIKDGKGREDEVIGEGVVGKQPILRPGESFEYTSFCPLRTRTGNMRGYFTFETSKGKVKAKIPLFFFRPDVERQALA